MILLGLGPAEAPILYHAVLGAILLAASGACVVYGEWGEAWYGKKDPGWIVADETAGQCIPLMALPLAAGAGVWSIATALLVAFLAFRAFDILKPPPAFALQKLPGGWGVLVDDLAAGFYALVATQLIILILP
jgi:phosphatidylglycerophosphatase A